MAFGGFGLNVFQGNAETAELVSAVRLRGARWVSGRDQVGEIVASAPIMRVRARKPNRKMASLAMGFSYASE
jgi:hypothetical protein